MAVYNIAIMRLCMIAAFALVVAQGGLVAHGGINVAQGLSPANNSLTAVIRAATQATGLPNLPAVRDLK
jgi:hypothetical protein